MFWNRFISLILAFCVVTTSSAVALSQLDRDTGERMTICSGGQSMVVEIGLDGEPVAPRHECPDCTVIAADIPTGTLEPQVICVERKLKSATTVLSQSSRSHLITTARAPPVLNF